MILPTEGYAKGRRLQLRLDFALLYIQKTNVMYIQVRYDEISLIIKYRSHVLLLNSAVIPTPLVLTLTNFFPCRSRSATKSRIGTSSE